MILTNEAIASRLRTRAAELARGRDNLYRIRAFRQAAMSVLMLPTPVADLLAKKGRAGLAELPGIGASLAETIEKLTNDREPESASDSRATALTAAKS